MSEKPTIKEMENRIKELEDEIFAYKKRINDETDRMIAEQALQESYERMEAILFSLPTGIMIIDVETHEILQANPQAMLMIGLPIEKIIGLKYHQFIDLPEVRGPNDDDLLCSGSEGKLLAADGEIVPVHQTVIPVTFDNRDCVIVNFADISEQKKAQSERIQKEKLQGIIELAGAVCHEMSQPLQVLAGLSELLAMEATEDNPTYKNLIKIIDQTNRISKITEKLRKVTRYETKGYLKGKIIDIDRAAFF